MSIIKTIYNISPSIKRQNINQTIVSLIYNGKVYNGIAYCHPNDMGFISKRVGERIALSRARLMIMKTERKRIADEAHWKRVIYCEITNNHFFDSEGNLKFQELATNLKKAEKRLRDLDAAIKKEEESLKKYLEGLDKVVSSIKRVRNKDKDN